MSGFSRRPLALLLGCWWAAASWHAAAADSRLPEAALEPLALADDLPVQLRSERRFNLLARKKRSAPPGSSAPLTPIAPPQDDGPPLFIVADHLQGRADELLDAAGKVELRKTGTLLYADRLQYRPLDDELEAHGQVRLLQEGTEVTTPHLLYRSGEQTGFAEQAEYRLSGERRSTFYRPQQQLAVATTSTLNTSGAPMMSYVPGSYGLPTTLKAVRATEANGQAERIDFLGENRFRLQQGTFSTCKPGSPDWFLRASQVLLDYDEEKGEAEDATLYFKDVPIFHAPSASFALNHQRRSGFLHPYYSASTKNGFDLTLPYYWNIAPNYDITLLPRYMVKRGQQLGMESRFLDSTYNGVLRAEIVPDDEQLHRQRFAFSLQHNHNLGQGLSAVINWAKVSDPYYWQDMSSRLLSTSQVQLPQQVALNYSPASWLQTSTQWLRYQTLQNDPTTQIARPYFVEPQFNLLAYKPNVMNTDFSLFGQYSRFTHPDKTNGDRLVLHPQVSLPVVAPAFQIIPKIGMHMTSYALSQQTAADQLAGQKLDFSRVLPTFSLDATTFFERDITWQGKDYIQTLEPRLFYVRIPYKDQSLFPNFDTALTDFNFAQIFAENRYSGQDRINDANQVTLALTTRLLGANTGAEQFKAMIGERYYFQSQRTALVGETQRKEDFSNLVAAATGLVAHRTYADVAWEYNHREQRSERFAAGMRYQPDYGRVLSASYRFTRDPATGQTLVDQLDLAGQWPLTGRWYAVGRYNFSLRDQQLLEAIGGLEYNAGCWAARFVVQRLEALAGSANTTFFLQLELNDFASVGSNPIGLLRRSIPGFGKINELPTGSGLLNTY